MGIKSLARASVALATTTALTLAAGCSKASTQTTVSLGNNLQTNARPIDADLSSYHVTRADVLNAKIRQGKALSIQNPAAARFIKTDTHLIAGKNFIERAASMESKGTVPESTSLVLGYPMAYVGEQSVFGGVITKVSDHTDTNLGDLKLSDVPMLHVRPLIAGIDTDKPQLALVGCLKDCDETASQEVIISIPIVAVDTEKNQLELDISALGSQLDIMSELDPDGSATGLKTAGTAATAADFSGVTLVFDVESHMNSGSVITARWYLRLASTFNPAFVPRAATPGVGFFMTERSKTPLITRWPETDYGTNGTIHYFIKNVPVDYQPAFQAALDAWNDHFTKIIGRKLLSYEFVPPGDPKNDQLVMGDVRYNIIEWDLTDLASYGGLGPSIGNQFTGELLWASVYIQGPSILKIYQDWFKVSEKVNALRAQGKTQEAEIVIRDYARAEAARAQAAANAPKLSVRLTPKLSFQVKSQMPGYRDPLAERNDFDELPPNVDYKTYMYGYFLDMLSHELGHNMGLRHNFRGNLGAADTGEEGSVSRSVMEYLNRRYRYLDHIDDYDDMAISYGYTGKAPEHTDQYCTDEDSVPDDDGDAPSAECSSNDATRDPFSFFEFRLETAIDYLTARGQAYAPVWTLNDMTTELPIALNGLLSYAASAEKTAAGWSNFFGKSGRPENDAARIKAFVLARLKQQLCDPNLATVVAGKYDPAAQKATQANIDALRALVVTMAEKAQVFTADELACTP